MKKFILLISAVVLIGLSNTANAQVSVNVNINSQPSWGPGGYQYARYYYLPDLNIYYDVANSIFRYLSGSRWISCRSLPSRYRHYDLYKMYKVVINNPSPWAHNRTYSYRYAKYRGNRTQVPIRDYNNKKNTMHNGSAGPGGRSMSDGRQQSNNGQHNGQRSDNNNRQQSNQKSQSNNSRQSNDRQQSQQRDRN